jgi:hypothetical protein
VGHVSVHCCSIATSYIVRAYSHPLGGDKPSPMCLARKFPHRNSRSAFSLSAKRMLSLKQNQVSLVCHSRRNLTIVFHFQNQFRCDAELPQDSVDRSTGRSRDRSRSEPLIRYRTTRRANHIGLAACQRMAKPIRCIPGSVARSSCAQIFPFRQQVADSISVAVLVPNPTKFE